MPCDVIQFPGGGGMIVCRRVQRRACHFCGAEHAKLCDYVLSDGRRCDRPLCGQHAVPGPLPNTDFCFTHLPLPAKGAA